MPDTTLNSTATVSAEMVKFYNKRLIDIAKPLLAYRRHAEESVIPKNNGKTINWRNFKKFEVKTDTLTEGVIPAGNKITIEPIEAHLAWYGDYVKISDQLELTALDPIIAETVERYGLNAGETLDKLAGLEMCSGTNVLYAGGVNARGNLTKDAVLTLNHIFRAAQFLKANSAPMIDGSYFAVVHPDVVCQLFTYLGENGTNPFIDVHKYSATKEIFDGEIGKIGGVRFIESANAITTTVDGNDGSLPVYQTVVYGKGALGCAKLSGGNLETIIKQRGRAGTADPLNQFSTVGWKAADACKILNNDNLIRIESCVDLGAIA